MQGIARDNHEYLGEIRSLNRIASESALAHAAKFDRIPAGLHAMERPSGFSRARRTKQVRSRLLLPAAGAVFWSSDPGAPSVV